MNYLHIFVKLLFVFEIFSPIDAHIYNNVSNIITIADVHGDINRFRYILQFEKIIDKYDNWIAKPNTIVIQLGDQIDEKGKNVIYDYKTHFDMIFYTHKMQIKALAKQSNLISLIGNHEHKNLNRILDKRDLTDIIANRPIVVKINNYIFCHASIKLDHVNILFENTLSFADLNNLWYKYIKSQYISNSELNIIESLILNNESIIYTKTPDNKFDTYSVLDTYNADYMFVGHMTTKHIHTKNRIWYLDQLLSDAFKDKSYTYITIYDDDIKIKTLNYHNNLLFFIF